MKRRDRALKKKRDRQKRLQRERNLRRNESRREGSPGGASGGYSDDEAEPAFPYDTERVLRAIHRAAGGRAFESTVDVEVLTARFRGRNVADLATEALQAGAREAAQELAFQALEAGAPESARALAQSALALDPDCCDALARMACLTSPTLQGRVPALEDALAREVRALGGEVFFAEHRGEFWGLVETRPYVRTLFELARVHFLTDRRDLACPHLRELVVLDAADHIGARHMLIGVLLELGDVAAAGELLARFGVDDSPMLAWGRVLQRFLAGDRVGASDALLEAREQLREFEDFLEGRVEAAEPAARETIMALGRSWLRAPGAIEWLRDGGRATSAEERARACQSFGAPVSELFHCGRVDRPRSDELDYVTRFGLTHEHVPELVRMLSERALHELDRDDPAVWAPLHAMRALGALRAEAAIAPLIEIGRTRHDDPWMEPIDALARIGAAALDPVAEWLRDASAPVMSRVIAAETLWSIGERWPDVRQRAIADLSALLLAHARNDDALNSFGVLGLLRLGAADCLTLIREAYEAGHVDRRIAGDLEEVARLLRSGEGPRSSR